MSIQSDIEMLSIEALEYYAKKHQISEDDAFNIFYKHQVFEKILVQHETLHQLDIHDTFQYVEDIIEEDTPTLVLFHGSNIAFDKIDLNKSHNRRDFGRGFYCTVLEQQANEWANRLYLRTHTGGKICVSVYLPAIRGTKNQTFCHLGQGMVGVCQTQPYCRRYPASL